MQVFRDDYDPVGLWAERMGVLSQALQNTSNIFACTGLYDTRGRAKDGITALVQDALP